MIDQRMIVRLIAIVDSCISEQDSLCRKWPKFTGETCESTPSCRAVKGLTEDLEYLQSIKTELRGIQKILKEGLPSLFFETYSTGTSNSFIDLSKGEGSS